MKISLEWIKEYVNLPGTLTSQQIMHDLTMAAVEVEEIINLADNMQKIVIADVIKVEKHPDADKLIVAECDFGEQTRKIVCGGINVVANMKVALALPGAKVFWHGEPGLVDVKETTIRGVASYGMICAASEIGLETLFPQKIEKSILDLSVFDASAGELVSTVLSLDDDVLDIDNKSLTNRPDLWGHYGVARELAAIYDLELKPLASFDLSKTDNNLSIEIMATDLCRRYTATRINGFKSQQSPYWLKNKLAKVGQRPINLLVDLTNYVMFALGQPNHAFDCQQVNEKIVIRKSQKDEFITLLDGQVLELDGQSLVIADADKPIALAGIMGGNDSSISDETQDLIFEVANFEALDIRKTATKLNIRTDSSTRFEKNLHPQLIDEALSLFINTLLAIQPDCQIVSFVDQHHTPVKVAELSVTADFLYKRLGVKIEAEKISNYLTRLGFAVTTKQNSFDVIAPYWRSTGDISLPEDIVEEVARLYGYDNFDFVAPNVSLISAVNQHRYRMIRQLKEYLAYRCGMYEVYTYPWAEDKGLEAFGFKDTKMLALTAAPSPETKHLQPSLLPQLIKAVSKNIRYFSDFKLFEMGAVFACHDESKQAAKTTEKLPEITKNIAGAFVGQDAKNLFLESKGVLENLHHLLHTDEIEFKKTGEMSWADKNAQLDLYQKDNKIGELGLLSSKAMRLLGLKKTRVMLFELSVDALIPAFSDKTAFNPLPEFPEVEYDFAVLVKESTSWSSIQQVVSQTDVMIKQVSFVDEYRGQQIPDGLKSIALKCKLGIADGTLTSEQVQSIIDQVIENLVKNLGAKFREE